MPKQLSPDASLRDVVLTLPHPRIYFANMLHCLQKAEKEHGPMVARIGVTGMGVIPNFRIENADASFRQAYDGVAFKAFTEAGTRDENWSTSVATTEEVFELLRLEIARKKMR